MKRFVKFVVLSIFLISINNVFAISEDFKYMIQEIGIPQYNVKNQEINEEIYEVYNMFIYGSPTSVKSNEQRWKSFSTGKWTKNGGKYLGIGTRGEYAILGSDYSSNIVYNYYFPLDRVTSVPIIKWTFLTVSGANASWQNAKNYYTEEQIQYMKEAKWWFQNITGGKNDPYDQIEYDLSVNKVGTSKARLETPATWKSKGSIYTERRTESGGIGWANFAVEPMSADARVESNLEVISEVILDENTDEIVIPITYGAELKDLSKYAKASHVKEIKSILKIDDKQVSEISGSKITSVGNEYMLVISRDKFSSGNNEEIINKYIKVTAESFVKTEFSADGLLKNTKSVDILVKIKSCIEPPIRNSKLQILMKKDDNLVVSPLAQNIQTINNESIGFCDAGRYLLLQSEINLDHFKIEDFKNIELLIDEVKMDTFNIIDTADNNLNIAFKLECDTNTTLYGLKSLREKTGNYFDILSSNILSRKSEPHKLELKYNVYSMSYSELLYFDTVDDIYSNVNQNLMDKVVVTKIGNEQLLNVLQGE